MNSIQTFGYSERGMVNALCYEMRHSPDGLRLVQEFLGLITFPFSQPNFAEVQGATFIIEQSFSDFGDLDLLILLDGPVEQAVLVEAKVKTAQTNEWSIAAQWAAFCDLPQAVAKTSNLFMQLYRKMRLVHAIRSSETSLEPNGRAPKSSLGQNAVVKTAADRLRDYCGNTWFVSLIPGPKADTQEYFARELVKPIPDLPHWDHRRLGFLNWGELEKHCQERPRDWPTMLENFAYNQGQIYGATIPSIPQRPPPPGSLVTWNDGTTKQAVAIKNRGQRNTRIVLENGSTVKVPNDQLHG